MSYQIESGKKQQREEYFIDEPTSSQGYAIDLTDNDEMIGDRNKSFSDGPVNSTGAPKIYLQELDELIEYVKFKSFSEDILFGFMEDLIAEIEKTVDSGGSVSEENVAKLLENARNLPEPLAKRTYEAILDHHSRLDFPLQAERLLDLYEIQTYAEQMDFSGVKMRSEILVDEVGPEIPETPGNEIDTTEVEDMTVSEARQNLSWYRNSKEPVEDEYRELVEDSLREYVASFDGHIRPD